METAVAGADLAYRLEAGRLQQSLTQAEMQVQLVERKKQIQVKSGSNNMAAELSCCQVEEAEVACRELELSAEVRVPGEAEAFAIATRAEAERTRLLAQARGEAGM